MVSLCSTSSYSCVHVLYSLSVSCSQNDCFFPRLNVKLASPYLCLSCFILTVPHPVFSFASLILICLFILSMFPCVSTFLNPPHVYLWCQFPFVSCQFVCFSRFTLQVSCSGLLLGPHHKWHTIFLWHRHVSCQGCSYFGYFDHEPLLIAKV